MNGCPMERDVVRAAANDAWPEANTAVAVAEEILKVVLAVLPFTPSESDIETTLDKSAASMADQAQEIMEVCDPAGRILGHFIPLATPEDYVRVEIKATEAEATLHGQQITDRVIAAAMEAARAAADPQPDMRGSAEYKRALVSALVKRAIKIAMRRARGEQVEASHIYA